mgnify:CR=1 FL=1
MKTLNRPMFRYGGPIKEGVMNGIREPKRNGGSMMGNDEGPRRAALVGNPIYPQGPDGRTGHFIPIAIGLGLRGAAGVAARAAARRAAAKGAGAMGTGGVRGQVPAIFKPGATAAGAGTPAAPGFLKSLFLDDPLVKAGMYGYKALTGAGAKSLGQKAVKVALSPSSIAAGIYFSNGKFFNKNDEEVIIDETGDVANTTTTKEEVIQKTPAEIEAAEAEARMKKMDKYKEIMDIKGMNKDAAYKSLIDASKIIQEGGNLKEQLKDGSLITKVTAAASKNFDKVRATENALSSLLVKSKIESDLRAEQGGPLMQQAKDLVAAGGAANIKEAMEYLSKKPSITQTATTFAKQFGKGFIDESTAVLAMQETFKERPEIVLSEKIFEEKKKEDGFKGVANLFETIKVKAKLGEGYYVIGGHGFVVDAQGNTKQVL